jgi:hypothetical protein
VVSTDLISPLPLRCGPSPIMSRVTRDRSAPGAQHYTRRHSMAPHLQKSRSWPDQPSSSAWQHRSEGLQDRGSICAGSALLGATSCRRSTRNPDRDALYQQYHGTLRETDRVQSMLDRDSLEDYSVLFSHPTNPCSLPSGIYCLLPSNMELNFYGLIPRSRMMCCRKRKYRNPERRTIDALTCLSRTTWCQGSLETDNM